MRGEQRGDIEVGDDVAVDDDERVVDPGVFRREPDRAGGVEWFGFHGVVESRTMAMAIQERLQERLGLEAERQGHVGDATLDEAPDEAGDHRLVTDREHRLRNVVRERPHPGAEPADEHDRAHQGVDVAVGAATVVVAATEVVVADVSPVTVSPVTLPSVTVPSVTVPVTAPPGTVVLEQVLGADLVRVGGAERRQVGGPWRHLNVGVARHERDREHHPVVPDRDVVEVGDVGGAVVGVAERVPHDDLQLPILGAALGLALDVLLAAELVVGELQRVVVELDFVDIEENAQLGVLPDRPRGIGMPVDDAVVVAVDAGLQEAVADELAGRRSSPRGCRRAAAMCHTGRTRTRRASDR